MNISFVQWALEMQVKPAEKLMLACFGTVYSSTTQTYSPSLENLMELSGYSKSQLYRIIN
jgi:hypothetical protein